MCATNKINLNLYGQILVILFKKLYYRGNYLLPYLAGIISGSFSSKSLGETLLNRGLVDDMVLQWLGTPDIFSSSIAWGRFCLRLTLTTTITVITTIVTKAPTRIPSIGEIPKSPSTARRRSKVMSTQQKQIFQILQNLVKHTCPFFCISKCNFLQYNTRATPFSVYCVKLYSEGNVRFQVVQEKVRFSEGSDVVAWFFCTCRVQLQEEMLRKTSIKAW